MVRKRPADSPVKRRAHLQIGVLTAMMLAARLGACQSAPPDDQQLNSEFAGSEAFARADVIAFGGGPGLADRMDLLVTNPDGSDLACLICDAAFDPVLSAPSWSPDGRAIAYSAIYPRSAAPTQSGINVTLDVGATVNLVRSPDEYDDPTWSPDGSEIAFSYRRRVEDDPDRPGASLWADPQICAVPFRTSGLPIPTAQFRCLTSEGWNVQPSWSPDGSEIAFTHSEGSDSPADIYVMSSDGTSMANLTDSPEHYDGEPRWSPDGKKIAFQRFDSELQQLDVWVMNADGTALTNLTLGPEDDHHPAWSPDGRQIVFVTTRTADPEQPGCEAGCLGNSELYVMGADGSNPLNVTNNPRGYAEQPDWRPRSSYSGSVPGIAVAGIGTLVIIGAAWVISRRRRVRSSSQGVDGPPFG